MGGYSPEALETIEKAEAAKNKKIGNAPPCEASGKSAIIKFRPGMVLSAMWKILSFEKHGSAFVK